MSGHPLLRSRDPVSCLEHNGPWFVTARYWLRAKGCIGYDLEHHYNRVQLNKEEEHLVYATEQHDGTLMGGRRG